MRDFLRVGVVQMTSGDDPAVNLSHVLSLYDGAVAAQAELVVYPENTLYFRVRPGDGPRAPSAEQLLALERRVTERSVPILLTTAFAPRDGRCANATLLFRPGRPAHSVYEKMHLFDIQLHDAEPVRESDHFRAGDQSAVIEVAGWRLGLSICYDLRFPELYLKYAQLADAILVPSAFLVATGRDHWHVLLRARAIEAQAFVIAPAQVGRHGSGEHRRETFGHALVVDPWGRVLSDAGADVGVRVIELRREDVNKMREQIPVADHRRPC